MGAIGVVGRGATREAPCGCDRGGRSATLAGCASVASLRAVPALGFHLVFRLCDDRPLAPSRAARRWLARVMSRLVEDFPVLAWRVVDTHQHVLGLFDEAQVQALARRLRLMLARGIHAGVPLLLTVRKPVLDQWHLGESFHYVLRQDAKHGVGNDPLQEGSSVLDVLGLRVTAPSLASRVRDHLPRVTRGSLLVHLGLSSLDEAPGTEGLAEAACSAFALPSLEGRGAAVVRARAAAIRAAEAPGSEVAAALGLTRQAVWKLARWDVHHREVRAVRLQAALRRAVPLDEGFVGESTGSSWRGPSVATTGRWADGLPVSTRSGRPRDLVELVDGAVGGRAAGVNQVGETAGPGGVG